MIADSKQRFSNRVENYVKYRPDYPRGILAMLRERIGLAPSWKVADIGSGTGISARMFLENGNEVFAIEPNAGMRAAAEKMLGDDPRFHSLDASAEHTTLPDASIDLIVAAQAFHWFDVPKCRVEFARIARPGAWCVLIWNERKLTGSKLLEAYEALMREHSADYMAVRHERVDAGVLQALYGSNAFQMQTFANEQRFDLEGLIGRCMSSSYAPATGDPKHPLVMDALKRMFDENHLNGEVAFEYQTQVYLGKLGR